MNKPKIETTQSPEITLDNSVQPTKKPEIDGKEKTSPDASSSQIMLRNLHSTSKTTNEKVSEVSKPPVDQKALNISSKLINAGNHSENQATEYKM